MAIFRFLIDRVERLFGYFERTSSIPPYAKSKIFALSATSRIVSK
jgi:hypothetical protein